MASSAFEIVVFTGFSTNPVAVASAARRNGFTTRFVSVSKEELDLSQFYHPLLFVEIEGNAKDVRRRITELAHYSSLYTYPVAIVGEGATQFDNLVKNFFPRSTVISVPFADKDIVDAVNKLLLSPQEGQTAPLLRNSSNSQAIEVAPSLRKSFGVFSASGGLPSLQKYSLGGKELVHASAPNRLPVNQFMPEHPKLKEQFRDTLKNSSLWNQGHHHRVAFAASRLTSPFEIPLSQAQDSKEAALAYAMASESTSSSTLREALHHDKSSGLRIRMGEVLELAGQRVVKDLQLKGAARILDIASKIMAEKTLSPDHDELLVSASALVASDFVNRACWSSGVWNQYGAYALFIRCRENSLPFQSDQIKAALIKMLLETAESGVPRKLLNTELGTNFALISLAKNQHTSLLSPHEKRLSLSELVPNVRLSRPLVAYDGTTIVDQNTQLDQDMIWRIWSLAMLRPLNAPLFVWIREEKPSVKRASL